MPASREPLIDYMVEALEESGCTSVRASDPSCAPFSIEFDNPSGNREGILAYAFLATSVETNNRPKDEWRFQIKYGSNDKKDHHLWQDRTGYYTTIMVGINPEVGIFVGADPVLNNPTRFFISKEFKQRHVDKIRKDHWHYWSRIWRSGVQKMDRTEVLVGGTKERFFDFVRFERDVLAESQGHRQLIADEIKQETFTPIIPIQPLYTDGGIDFPGDDLHVLEQELGLPQSQILDLMHNRFRLRTAVRGAAAEAHLQRVLLDTEGVEDCFQLDQDGRPDFEVTYKGQKGVLIECKNVLSPSKDAHGKRKKSAGPPTVDFQKTRASKNDPNCSRYYRKTDFHILAACLHSQTKKWEFRYQQTSLIGEHKKCSDRLHHRLRVDDSWKVDLQEALDGVTR